MKKNLILIGDGGHSASCADVIEAEGNFKIAGLVSSINQKSKNKSKFKIIGTDADLEHLRKKFNYAFISLGHLRSNKTRIDILEKLKSLEFHLPTIKSPHSYVSKNSSIGEGSIIMHGCIINSGVNIGKNCIINSMSLLEHGVSIGDNCHISTGVKINGDVIVESNCFIGSNTVIKQNTSIKKNTFIKMSSSIKNDI